MLVTTKRRSSFTSMLSLCALLSCSAVSAQTFNIQKRNTNFSIDGNGGARIGQQAYLWNTSNSNVNQQWVETEVADGFYSCLLYTSPSPRDGLLSRMPSSA